MAIIKAVKDGEQRIQTGTYGGGLPIATEMLKTGIDVIGDIAAWGTHFCLFYETKEDLLL
jgi:hypothetical protein